MNKDKIRKQRRKVRELEKEMRIGRDIQEKEERTGKRKNGDRWDRIEVG